MTHKLMVHKLSLSSLKPGIKIWPFNQGFYNLLLALGGIYGMLLRGFVYGKNYFPILHLSSVKKIESIDLSFISSSRRLPLRVSYL